MSTAYSLYGLGLRFSPFLCTYYCFLFHCLKCLHAPLLTSIFSVRHGPYKICKRQHFNYQADDPKGSLHNTAIYRINAPTVVNIAHSINDSLNAYL